MRFFPNTRDTAEETKRRVWREEGMLVINIDKDNLTWDQREMLKQIGTKLFGARRQNGSAVSRG